ncbi:MAG: SNARE associated Golgi protein [Candidatus Lokiarchaeum sp. GC14_75]|nr:MAG: SNARE associated Golgi protein [Candidatus Lokiarchaeum sp. GC14_75]
MNLKKVDIIFTVLIIAIAVLSLDLLLNPFHREVIENISNYAPFQDLSTGLLITFWVCLIGNLLPVPTPYTFVVCFSSIPFLQLNFFIPFIVGFIASLGCLVGEMGGYIVGRGASKFISDEKSKKLIVYQHYLVDHPKIAALLIFLFGFTPLNDDMLTIPLGLIKFNVKKTIFWIWLGKLCLMLIFAYNIVNICSLLGGDNWILSIVTLFLIVIIVYLMLRVDFVKLFKKPKN